jgi:hypothetical protein
MKRQYGWQLATMAGMVGLLSACRPSEVVSVPQTGLRGEILCVSGCYGVQVTPDGGYLRVPPPGGSADFVVTNTGQVTTTYAITCYGGINSSATCTAVSDSSVTLNPNQATDVTAYFTGFGRLILKAAASAASDTGWYKIIPQL